MTLTDITKGAKLQMALAPDVGDAFTFNMVSTFAEAVDESSFLISAPMEGTKPMQPDEIQKYLVKIPMGNEDVIISAYCDDLVKKGVRHYWKMRRVSESRQYYQRADERFKASLKCNYYQSTWALNYEGKITPEEAMTMDLSAGGAALFLNYHYDVGEIIQVNLPRVGIDPRGAAIDNVICSICWYRDVPKGSQYRFCCGVQFRFANEQEREQIRQYIDNLKDTYKL